jgi:hypothetical protein
MAQAKMKTLVSTKSSGLYWAKRGVFLYPGLHVQIGKWHVRLIPLPQQGRIKANLTPDSKSFKNSVLNGAKFGLLVAVVVDSIILIIR